MAASASAMLDTNHNIGPLARSQAVVLLEHARFHFSRGFRTLNGQSLQLGLQIGFALVNLT